MGLHVRLLLELYTRITEVQVEVEQEQEHSKMQVGQLETLLQWSDVPVVVERVELGFLPIRPIPRGVEVPQMVMSRSVTSTSLAKLDNHQIIDPPRTLGNQLLLVDHG